MGKASRTTVQNLQGIRYLQRLKPLLERLRAAGCERDRAGNRELFYDDVCSLILLTFFNPSLETLRDLSKASQLKKVRKKLGCKATCRSSLSEALHVFDPQLLEPLIEELLGQIPDSPHADPRLNQLAFVPKAVDGSILRHLPQITQACFDSRKDRGWKLHAHFEVLRGVATLMRVTDASGQGAANEKAVLRSCLTPDSCYIIDRGYEEFSLFNAIVAAGSSYVCGVKKDHHFTRIETRELSAEAQAAGVIEDVVGRMGSPKSTRIEHPNHLQRRIVIRVTKHPKRTGHRGQAVTQDIVLVTNLLDVPPEVIALLFRYRWLIELFFRWLKCVLSCRHLLSESEDGIQIQMYCALIACLLIQLAGGDVKPNRWTYKLLCLYVSGWATEDELLAHLSERRAAAEKNGN